MIKYNSLGKEIISPENFWKWFGNSITVDEKGRPMVFYHGTRSDFTEFKSGYSDQLIFFSYEKSFADKWGKKKQYDNDKLLEIEDILFPYKNELYTKFKQKYGDNFYQENDKAREELLKQIEEKRIELEKERNIHSRTLGCYLKVHKLFIPEKDYELVLDEICKYYEWKNPYTKEYENRLKYFEDEYDKAQAHWDEWWANNKNAEEETIQAEEKKLDLAFRKYSVYKSIKNEFDNNLERIKKGAWTYFEHGNVIDKIYKLGYDGIQLSETNGEQTTIAVRPNQIKSVDNKGTWSNNSNNIYETLNNKLLTILENLK